MKFKVGDRIRYLEYKDSIYGVIVALHTSYSLYDVSWDGMKQPISHSIGFIDKMSTLLVDPNELLKEIL